LESERIRLCRLDLERDTGRGPFTLGDGVVIASTGMATVETPPYINNAVSTWNALQVQLARGSLITQMMVGNWYSWYRRVDVCPWKVWQFPNAPWTWSLGNFRDFLDLIKFEILHKGPPYGGMNYFGGMQGSLFLPVSLFIPRSTSCATPGQHSCSLQGRIFFFLRDIKHAIGS
jgi:hypothetical protein